MLNKKILLLTGGLLFSCSSEQNSESLYDVVKSAITADDGNALILAGQSLSLGVQGGAALTTSSLYSNVERSGTSLPFCDAVEGTGSCGSGSDVEMPHSPSMNQIRALSSSYGWIGSTAASCSGCAYSSIKKGTTTYNNVYANSGVVEDAYTAKNGASLPYRVGAIHMHHGETDTTNSNCSTYNDMLEEYLTDTRASVNTEIGQTEEFDLYVSQLNSGNIYISTDQSPECPIKQLQAAEDNVNEIVLCTPKYHLSTGTTNIYANSTSGHLTNAGYRMLGEIMGRCTYSHGIQGNTWYGVTPNTITATNSSIVVAYHDTPCMQLSDCNGSTELVFDTTAVTCPGTGDQVDSTTNCLMGFELSCPGPNPPYLSAPPSITDTTVTLTANKNLYTGCTLSYAYTAHVDGGAAGNGNTISKAWASIRGNLRDTGTTTGVGSGNAMVQWGSTFSKSVSGGVSPPSSVATEIDDINWKYGYGSSSCSCPSASSTFTAAFGGSTYDLPYRVGSWSCATATGDDMAASEIATERVDNALSATSGSEPCWSTTGTNNTQFNIAANEDLWYRHIGKIKRAASGTDYLFVLQGDTGSTNHRVYVAVTSGGNLTASYYSSQNGGGNAATTISALIPSTPAHGVLDVIFQKHGAPSGPSAIIICYNGACSRGVQTVTFGSFGPGNLMLNGGLTSCATASSHTGETLFAGFVQGEMARNQYKNYKTFQTIHDASYDALCHPTSQPCTSP